jgi:hypothetical protein
MCSDFIVVWATRKPPLSIFYTSFVIWPRDHYMHLQRSTPVRMSCFAIGFPLLDVTQYNEAPFTVAKVFPLLVIILDNNDWHVPRRAWLRAKQTRHGSYPQIHKGSNSSKGHCSLDTIPLGPFCTVRPHRYSHTSPAPLTRQLTRAFLIS